MLSLPFENSKAAAACPYSTHLSSLRLHDNQRRLFPEEPCFGGLAGLEMVGPKGEREGMVPTTTRWLNGSNQTAIPWWTMKPEAWRHPRGGHNWVCTSL